VPRSGFTHVLPAAIANVYQRISPSSETTVTLERDCVALILAAETATCYVTFDDTVASATNGLPVLQAAQPIYIPLGRVACTNAHLRAFSATGALHILQLA